MGQTIKSCENGTVKTIIYTCTIDTPLGIMTASAENEALTGLWYIDQKHYPTETDTWIYEPSYSVFEILRIWLVDYFSGKNPVLSLKLNPQGTSFRRAVWDILSEIPMGQVTTYGKIAKKLAVNKNLPSMSAQAVGGAVGHNPISILIPCHRVIGSNGNLTGYDGGLDRKVTLLQLEHADLATPKLNAAQKHSKRIKIKNTSLCKAPSADS
jgi:methylated-DNA-[protein]-cysteine S-methyltransferase